MRYKAYRYRLYPNKEQQQLINKHIGSCRYVYNFGLEMKTSAYERDKTALSRFQIQSELPKLKQCGVTNDRDLLAARNIKMFAFCKNNTAGTAGIHACGDMAEVTRSAQEADKSLA